MSFACRIVLTLCLVGTYALAASFVPRALPESMTLGNCDAGTFTVSGISAGACMTVQFQYAHSQLVKGAGIVAAAPYQCSGGSLAGAEMCMNAPSLTNVDELMEDVSIAESFAEIDPITNLKDHTIYLFSGWLDTVVPQQNMKNVLQMYESYGVKKITTYFNYSAEHSWVTDTYGNPCSYLGSPYVNNCGLDFAGEFLSGSFANLNQTWNATKGTLNTANMFTFDQTQFGASPLTNSLATTGYMYVPVQCQTNTGVQCHLHLNLHGCTQDANAIGLDYVLQTEINEWAESNNIIVLYPQVTGNMMEMNPNACFDWWGYAGSNYAYKSGVQITFLRALVEKYGGF